MRVGVLLPYGEGAVAPAHLAEFAQAVEASGFDGVWTFDIVAREHPYTDPLMALAVAASVTRDVELGTAILQLPLRPPSVLGHQLMTLQDVAGRRLRLGVGAGSTPSDFDVAGVAFEDRFRLLRQRLEWLEQMYLAASTEHPLIPGWPGISTRPPLFIGSWAGGSWIERAAVEYEGWIASAAKTTRETLVSGIKKFRSLGGKRALVANVLVDLQARPSREAPEAPFDLRCPPDVAAQRIAWLSSLGYNDLIVVVPTWQSGGLEALASVLRAVR